MRWQIALIWLGTALTLVLVGSRAPARDRTGLSDRLTPQQQEWVSGLTNKGGYRCCDDADGLDPVWRTWSASPSGYQVMIDDEWVDVSRGALIEESNKIGVARYWIWYVQGRKAVKCFLPGAGG